MDYQDLLSGPWLSGALLHVTVQGQDISGACGQLVVEHDAAKAAVSGGNGGGGCAASEVGGAAGGGDTGGALPVADIEEVGGGGALRAPLAVLKALFV